MILDKIVLLAALTASMQSAMPFQASGEPANGVMSGDSVPDVEAYKALFLLLSDGSNALPRADRQSILAPTGLGAEELNIIIDAANQYRIYVNQAIRQNKAILVSRRKGAPLQESTMVALDAVQDEHNALTRSLIQDLEGKLEPSSVLNLLQFMRAKLKPNMTFRPGSRR